MVILITRNLLSKEAFDVWGWRVPFWVSIIMVFLSYVIRRKMHESPLFAKAKAEGKTSTNPLRESFGNRYNLKFVLLALFGAAMGQGVVWYTGQFYAMSFIQKVCNVESAQTDSLMAIGLLMGTPFFVVFGGLSDKIGRKSIMMAGMLIAILAYRPIYKKIFETSGLQHRTEIVENRTTTVDARLLPGGDSSYHYAITHHYQDGTVYAYDSTITVKAGAQAATVAPKIARSITLNNSDKWTLIFLVFIQVIFVTMVYGPIAAFLVEMFPIKIRYTSMSLPYHVGNGIFGGLLPTVATYLATKGKDSGVETWYLDGLWYPIIIAGISFVIGMLYIQAKNKTVHD